MMETSLRRFPGRAMKSILIVDDDASVRQSLASALASENYRVLTAPNGEDALTIVTAYKVDLVLLDLNMPVKGGWDTFERLTFDFPLIPVIIITARANQLFTALGAGAGALLEKPPDFFKLLATMRTLLDEEPEQRLARVAGRASEFHYLPASAAKAGVGN
jgi:DNA-binding response OmpR family regulator